MWRPHTKFDTFASSLGTQAELVGQRTAGKGHEERFPTPRLSDRCRLRMRSLAVDDRRQGLLGQVLIGCSPTGCLLHPIGRTGPPRHRGGPVRFEITEQTRSALGDWLAAFDARRGGYFFPSLQPSSCRRTRIVQTSLSFNGRFWPVTRPLFQGARCREGTGFSAVMVVSDKADPFHLSAGSPSTGQPAYSGKALMRQFQRKLGSDT